MQTLNEERQQAYFDELASRARVAQNGPAHIMAHEDVLRTINSLPRQQKVLEIGCGDGSSGFTEAFLRHGKTVTFCDISHDAVEALDRHLSNSGLNDYVALKGTLRDNHEKIQGQKFDVIFFGDTLHHLTIDESVELFRSLREYMDSDSRIVAYEPNGNYPFWRLMPYWNSEFVWEMERNIVHCTRRQFSRKFSAAGLKLESYKYQRIVPMPLLGIPFFKTVNSVLIGMYGAAFLSPHTILIAKA